MKLIKDNEIQFDVLIHSSANPFSVTNGKKWVEYIKINQIEENTFLAKIKVVCIHNALSQSFDMILEQTFNYEGDDLLDVAVELYNNLNSKILKQTEYKWIKSKLENNPPKDLIDRVTSVTLIGS